MNHLLSYKFQIEPNLRRTASKGLISLLNHQQLENLAFKHFGVKDEYGHIIGYQCPFSGKVYNDYKDIVLEHIVPVSSNGGTILFNCIPASKEINQIDKKDAKHLIEWWKNSNYWDEKAPHRLEKLVNYMLDAYEQVFKEYTVNAVETSYLNIELDEQILDEEENPDIYERTKRKIENQSENNGIHSYLGVLLYCINELEKNNISISNIKKRLQKLQDKKIFKDVKKYELYQKVIRKLVMSRIADKDSSYISYTLNFDINKLINSINLEKEQDIYDELNLRLTNIERLLKTNNVSIFDYLKSVKDIRNIDLIYKNVKNISREEENVFLENIRIGLDKKIEIFIDMLNQGNTEILKKGNNESLKGYPKIKLSNFWQNNHKIIKQRLFVDMKDKPTYNKARKFVEIKEVENNLDKKITIFIKMLNKGNTKILTTGNKETLEGYPSIKLSGFWGRNQEIIKQKLFIELHDKLEYDTARKLIAINEIKNNLDKRISIFIEMLNKGNAKILTRGNKEVLEGYPSIKLSNFWQENQEIIKQKLFVNLKHDPKYNTARKLIVINEVENNLDKKISIFIEMLNNGNINILKDKNKEVLDGYPNIKLSNFWSKHQERIKQKLFIELKDSKKYDTARKLIAINKVETDNERKLEIFIEMLNKGNINILKHGNKETLEGYPNIKLSQFWSNHQERIKPKLFVELKDNKKYDIARKLITINEIENSIDKKISIFIEMLNKGNINILKHGNKEALEGYPSIKLSNFWSSHQERIKQKLFIELKDNPKYNIARQTVLTYFKVSTYEELEAKQNKGKKLQEAKKLKQELVEAIKYIDELEVTEEVQRKRA